MYKQENRLQTEMDFGAFFLPFGGKLDKGNRWIRLSTLIPWAEFEASYAEQFGSTGNAAKTLRMALGSLIIKERLGLTDRETVEQIRENPYLQYFIGLTTYQSEAPFDASSMVYFRKRFDAAFIGKLNERICREEAVDKAESSTEEEPSLSGKLIIDATCAPEDLRHPTDLTLLSDARETTEAVIDELWKSCGPIGKFREKPRTYRRNARKDYVKVIKSKKPSLQVLRKGIKRQLGYVGRNLGTIRKMVCANYSLTVLDRTLYLKLLVASEVYRQQKDHVDSIGHKGRYIEDRIVSISKPHVRPIVRGKSGAEVEFGAKLSVSVIEGNVFLDRLSWDAYHEGGDLKMQAEKYKERTGHYPESIHADKAYRSRDNLKWCKKNGIRLSGPHLGRPPAPNEHTKEERKLQRQDEIDRIEVEGKFGVGKRRYGLSRIMARLRTTSEHMIALVFLVMNLEKALRGLLLYLFRVVFGNCGAYGEGFVEKMNSSICRHLRRMQSSEAMLPALIPGKFNLFTI